MFANRFLSIIKSILQGYASPISSLQSSKSFGYDPALTSYAYDPAKAKQLLEAAGVKPGTSVGIDFIGTDAMAGRLFMSVRPGTSPNPPYTMVSS